ncbi:MAG: hypothetical protein A2600_00610 [Candidatus Lambdaproteobacteria bacterium RIFOXYD1_FULL_56_27]|uniref:Uncharacterized protein n=1 Tax=Candidatus Lambdaproteobacteria bacterium RIFOXYD2_FULL_56_26 TaxID=1817773 RepID=A0A1F6GLS9_9PROT|nr:MAG: hypothetical protein A2557_09910 [Candidatus Lambdaproteobacteria bacterium RIFOXYD2_FULL_56_26]OGH01453.1 MAG: hypothetical protein A2426_08695 [Candidatus Lambdaproteobacteria bacterium RIFOXYC1_FULL_56_13]OGH07059.1 MAG: hypothetical protein A2600_00610 [Candidatus Lambdaproteobacteria bacterium RIFOXYD1_FULL_56_27]
MQSSSDQTITAPSFTVTVSGVQVSLSCTNASNLDARMIYKNAAGTGYVPYLEGATTNIIDAFVNLMILERDSLGAFKPTVAGDGIVSFKELLCVQ